MIVAHVIKRLFRGVAVGIARHWITSLLVLVMLGGIVYGFLAVRTRLLFADPVTSLQRSRQIREVERHEDDDQKVDQLLEKIAKEGMSALSKREREFLKRVSSRR